MLGDEGCPITVGILPSTKCQMISVTVTIQESPLANGCSEYCEIIACECSALSHITEGVSAMAIATRSASESDGGYNSLRLDSDKY
jgi:hypothetical protein